MATLEELKSQPGMIVNGNLVTMDSHTCAFCGADWNEGQWSPGCPSCEDCNYVRNPHPPLGPLFHE